MTMTDFIDTDFLVTDLIELVTETAAYQTQYSSEMQLTNHVDKEIRYNHRD